MKSEASIGVLLAQFALFSLLSFGGVSSVLSDMHRFLVEENAFLTETQFVELFTIGRAAPGPNVVYVTLFGWKLAGLWGALATTAGMCVPSALVAYAFVRLWGRMPSMVWRRAIEGALGWMAGGFMLAAGYVLTMAADHSVVAFAITAVAATLTYATRINPLWMLLAAAGLGIAGLV